MRTDRSIGATLGLVIGWGVYLGAQAVFGLVTPVAGDILGPSTPFSLLNLPPNTTNVEVCLFDKNTGTKVIDLKRPTTGVIPAGQTSYSDVVSFPVMTPGDYDFGVTAYPSLISTLKVRVTIPQGTPNPTPTPTPTPNPTPTPIPTTVEIGPASITAMGVAAAQAVSSNFTSLTTAILNLSAMHVPQPPSAPLPTANCVYTIVNSTSVYLRCARSDFPAVVVNGTAKVIK